MSEEKHQTPKLSIAVFLPVVWAILAFAAGTVFSAGMGWGHNSDALNNLVANVARLEGAIDQLSTRYTASDKNVTQQLQKIEDHLDYDDVRLDRLEGHGK